MKVLQQHQLETVSGGLLAWHVLRPAGGWATPMDGEWLELPETVAPPGPEVAPPSPVQICPINDGAGNGF